MRIDEYFTRYKQILLHTIFLFFLENGRFNSLKFQSHHSPFRSFHFLFWKRSLILEAALPSQVVLPFQSPFELHGQTRRLFKIYMECRTQEYYISSEIFPCTFTQQCLLNVIVAYIFEYLTNARYRISNDTGFQFCISCQNTVFS